MSDQVEKLWMQKGKSVRGSLSRKDIEQLLKTKPEKIFIKGKVKVMELRKVLSDLKE